MNEVIIMKWIICAVIAAIMTLSPGSESPEERSDEEKSAYVLIEQRTRIVLDEENSDAEMNAGYLGKLMSLLMFAEDLETGKYRLDTEVTVSQSVINTQGAVIWLEPGEKITVEELLKGIIIGNANDAVTVLSEKSAGSVEDFVSRMNSEAFDLGLRHTGFYSPYGYYDTREHTTAYELAVICSELSRYDQLTPYFKIWRDVVRSGKTELVSENRLTRKYERHIGFKACHSDQSGYCIAEAGRNEKGDVFIAVVLGKEDAETAESEARRLLRSGFTDYRITTASFPEEFLKPLKVMNGTDGAVGIRLRNCEQVIVPKSSGELSAVTVMPEQITAPVRRGQQIGVVGFYCGKKLIKETEIVTCDSVDALSYTFVLRFLLSKLLE